MITKGSKVRCVAHDGEHRGTVAAEYGQGRLTVAWDLQAELR